MRYSVTQGEIVEVNFQMPDNSLKPHPALVLSTAELLEDEDFFYVVLLSTKNIFPKYTLRFRMARYTVTIETDKIAAFKKILKALGLVEQTKNSFVEPTAKTPPVSNRLV
jgi:hypothetical protein